MALSARSLLALVVVLCLSTTASCQAHPYPSYFGAVLTAHGSLGAIAWVILFPLGGIIIRVFDSEHVFWAHAACQLLAYSCFCFTFGSGVWFGWLYGSYTDPHVVIGIIVFALTSMQPFLGTIHHQKLKKYERRTFASIVHIHLGRALVTVGMINGGLGFLLAENATKGEVQAYGIIAGIVWACYILVVSYMEVLDAKEEKKRCDLLGNIEGPARRGTIEDSKFGFYE